MTFLKRITRTFAPQPLTLRMDLSDESIMLDFRRGDDVLDYQTLLSDPVGKVLPEKVLEYLGKNIGAVSGYYPVPYPSALQLLRGLRQLQNANLLFDCAIVENLQVIARPVHFRLRWIYNPGLNALVRGISGAERHLGKCWFQQGNLIWQLDAAISDSLLKWLSAPTMNEQYAFRFIADILPECLRLGYPIASDLRILDGITFKLHIRTTSKSQLRVALECSHPQFVQSAVPLLGDEKNMRSGNTLLPNLRPLLTEPLREIFQSGEKNFTGYQIPIFIQDELRPRAAQLGVDMAEIDQFYPIVPADQLKPSWHIEKSTEQGIGIHKATSSIAYDGHYVSLSELHGIAAQRRFYNLNETWIEFTPTFLAKLQTAIKSGLTSFDLTPAELLGSASERLLRLKLTAPPLPEVKFDLAPTIREQREQARALLATLRSYGLPAGISGLQVNRQRLLADMCLALSSSHDSFKVLWIVGKKRRDALQETLREARDAYGEDIRADNISLLSPDELSQAIAETGWSLVIFQDIDQITPSANFARAYQSIRRLWTVATFNNAHWHENPALLEKVLQALKLTSENASAFLEICHHRFADQQEDLITKIAPPFKRLFVDSSDDVDAAPIPQREPPPVVAMKPEVGEFYAPPSAPETTPYASPGEEFIQQAQQFAQRASPPTEPIPFTHYYPTYRAMSPEQLDWYFYWRDQYRHGNAIATDLSYLFVHIYEGLNLIGFEDAQAAFDHLVALWTQYRALQPKLDRYLVDWLADFVVVHRLPIDPLDWYARVLLMGNNGGDPDLALTAWVNSRNYEAFPLELWLRTIRYTPEKDKFYRDNKHNETTVHAAFIKGIRAIDEWLLQGDWQPNREQRGLFERYAPPVFEVTRPPFAGAVHQYGSAAIRIGQTSQWSKATEFADDLAGILKYIENIVREQAGYPSKSRRPRIAHLWKFVLDQAFNVTSSAVAPAKKRGRPLRSALPSQDGTGELPGVTRSTPAVSFPPAQSQGETDEFPTVANPTPVRASTELPSQDETGEIPAVIARAPATPAKPAEAYANADDDQEFMLDTAVLARLEQETERLHARLFAADEAEIAEEQQSEAPAHKSPEASSPGLPVSYTQRPPDAPNGLLTDLQEIAVAMGAPGDIGAKLLRVLRNHEWQVEPETLELVVEQGFLNLHLDAINERAFEQFSDALIFFEAGFWVVTEDYRDEIAYILDHPAYGTVQPQPTDSESAQVSAATYVDLSEEWASFARQLQPQHWETIAVLLRPMDVGIRLDAIARSAYTTRNLLIDRINDAAMDALGDIVIDTIPDPPLIEAEDWDMLVQLLEWASRNQLLEL